MKDNRITVIHKKNGGVSDARNAGLAIASGKYISFIDPDDYIHVQFYQHLINLLVTHQADIAQCTFLKVSAEYNFNSNLHQCTTEEKITLLNSKDMLYHLFDDTNIAYITNKLYNKKLFDQLCFPKGKIYEDEYTTPKVIYNAERVILTSKPMYYYLLRPDGYTGGEFTKQRLDILDASYDQISFFQSVGLYDLESKATTRLEKRIRRLMSQVLESNVNNKDEIFMELVYHYRQNCDLFDNIKNISLKRKMVAFLFRYDISVYIYKLLYKVRGLALTCRKEMIVK